METSENPVVGRVQEKVNSIEYSDKRFVEAIREKINDLEHSDKTGECFFVRWDVLFSQGVSRGYAVFTSEKEMMAAFAGELESIIKMCSSQDCLKSKQEFDVCFEDPSRRKEDFLTEDDRGLIHRYTTDWEFRIYDIRRFSINPNNSLNQISIFSGDVELCNSYDRELLISNSSNFKGAAGRVVKKFFPSYGEPLPPFPESSRYLNDSPIKLFDDWILLYVLNGELNLGWRFDQEIQEDEAKGEFTDDCDDEYEFIFIPVDMMQSFV